MSDKAKETIENQGRADAVAKHKDDEEANVTCDAKHPLKVASFEW